MATGQLSTVLRHLRRLAVRSDKSWLSDAQLLERFVRSRDEAVFELLVWRHGSMVLNVCRRVLRNFHDADDAFQATFLTLVKKAGSIGKREAVASWLYKVAYRVALRARQQSAKRIDNRQDGVERLAAEPPDEVAWRDLRPVLDEEVNRLPSRYRTPFILCYLQGKTNAEAAALLGCPRGTIATQLSRARALLRGRLTRRGLALSGACLGSCLASESLAAVPAALVDATMKSSLAYAGGKAVAAGLVSTKVALLSEGVVKAMLLTKLKIAAVVVLTVGALGTGTGVATYQAVAAGPGDSLATYVGQKKDKNAEAKLREELEALRQEALQLRDRATAAEAAARVQAEKAHHDADKERVLRQAAEAELLKLKKEIENVRKNLEDPFKPAANAPATDTAIAKAEKHLKEIRTARSKTEVLRNTEAVRTEIEKANKDWSAAIQAAMIDVGVRNSPKIESSQALYQYYVAESVRIERIGPAATQAEKDSVRTRRDHGLSNWHSEVEEALVEIVDPKGRNRLQAAERELRFAESNLQIAKHQYLKALGQEPSLTTLAQKHLKAIHAARLKLETLAIGKASQLETDKATKTWSDAVRAAVAELLDAANKAPEREVPGLRKHLPDMQEQRAAFDFSSAQLLRVEQLRTAAAVSDAERTTARAQYEKALAGWSKAVEAALEEIAQPKRATP